MLSMESTAMKEANKVFQAFYTNPKERYAYEVAKRLEAEKETLYSVGRSEGYSEEKEEGIFQGISQGISQRNFEIVWNMKSAGMSDSDIIKYTGLTLQEIKKL